MAAASWPLTDALAQAGATTRAAQRTAAPITQQVPIDVSDPRKSHEALQQASAQWREGKADEALRTLDASLRDAPRNPQLRFLYGYILNAQGRVDQARDVFEQLTQDFPELPEPYNNLAVILAARGELDQARRALEQAVRVLPTYSVAHENLGDVYLRMAARAYDRAVRGDPGNATARLRLDQARALLDRMVATPAGARPAPPANPPSGPGAGPDVNPPPTNRN